MSGISGQHEFRELAGVAEKTDAALLINLERLMQSCFQRLSIFSWCLERYHCGKSVTSCSDNDSVCRTTLMGGFSCLGSISPCSYPGRIPFHIWGINSAINEVETGIFSLKGRLFLFPSALFLWDLHSESIHSCSNWANNTTKGFG